MFGSYGVQVPVDSNFSRGLSGVTFAHLYRDVFMIKTDQTWRNILVQTQLIFH